MKNNRKLEIFWLFVLFVVGVVFRMWFITLAPQLYGYDQYEYDMYAEKMIHSPYFIASHSYRNYPLPLMLTVIYSFFGFANHVPVFWLHAILDSITSVFVFFILKHSFKNSVIPWVGMVLSTFNIFTAGYVGVVLSEVLSAFFITGSILFGLLFVKKPTIVLGLLFGFFTGMAAETRGAALMWAAVPLGVSVFYVSIVKHWAKYVCIVFGFMLTVLYPLAANWQTYREINISTVDSIFARELFNGAILKRLPPFTYAYPREVQLMYFEYYSEYDPGRTKEERKQMADRYIQKAMRIIKEDPADYIKTRFEKMWYVWQKENIFFYEEPNFEAHKHYTYTLNLIILFFTGAGLYGMGRVLLRSRRVNKAQAFVWASILYTILYGTFAFSITHAEYRLTIPFYPLLLVMGTIGLFWLVQTLRQGISKGADASVF